MFNKLYEWIGIGIASLRNGAPANDRGEEVEQDGQNSRKRSISCVEDGEAVNQETAAVKKFKMGDWIDTVKVAAQGVKTQGTRVALWVKSNVGPTLSNILPASPGPPALRPPPDPPAPASRSAPTLWEEIEETEFVVRTAGCDTDTFVVPSSTLAWKSSKTDSVRTDRGVAGPWPRPSCSHLPQQEAPKTNGHSAVLPPTPVPKRCPSPRLGRTLNLTPRRSPSSVASSGGSTGSPYTSMYEKTFPIRAVQSPTHSSSLRPWRRRVHCAAQESIRLEEKEVYRQLLAVVSEGQSALYRDGSPCTALHSHRDLTSFLSSNRKLLQSSRPPGSSEGNSGFTSPGSSTIPSPRAESGGAQTPHSSPAPREASTEPTDSAPSPASSHMQGQSSNIVLSSASDGDSVIFVKEQQGEKIDASSVPCFQAELWIKELTSLYDSRARERRRLIEEQEALTARLLKQRLSDEGHVAQHAVELKLRVPLEKEVPVAPVAEETKVAEEEPEFPELTEDMQMQVSRALKGGSQDEVLSEGFRLTITRKDIQTLSNLNWLNDEVINFYMNMLVERSRRSDLPSVHTFNTFFYPKLRSSGFSAVRRWTKKVDIFASDILLVPVHLGVHWCLTVVDIRKKSISYFDSMGGSNIEACRILLKYLEQESQDKTGKKLDTSDWVLQSMKRNEIPQQMNGSDCGMFTCKYAEYITKDRPITFTQKHMPYFRRRMVWEILNRKLL